MQHTRVDIIEFGEIDLHLRTSGQGTILLRI